MSFHFWSCEKLSPLVKTPTKWRLVNELYQGTPCSTCGVRFTKRKEHDDHLDWHFHKNREAKKQLEYNGKEGWKYRNLQVQKEWKKAATKVDIVECASRYGLECLVCEERFETYFDDEQEAWLFRDIVDMSNEIFVHKNCY